MQYIEPHQPNKDTRLEGWFIKEGIPGLEDGLPMSLFDRVDLLCCKMICKARQADRERDTAAHEHASFLENMGSSYGRPDWR